MLYMTTDTQDLEDAAAVRDDSEGWDSDSIFIQITTNRLTPASSLLFIWCSAQDQRRDGELLCYAIGTSALLNTENSSMSN